MNIENRIKEICSNAITPLIEVSKNGAKAKFVYEFDCEVLEDYLNRNILESEDYQFLFSNLKSMKGPCLYFFEIISDFDAQVLLKNFKDYSFSNGSRSTPALKVNIPNSNILYVGKVKRFIYGRMIQHLGYHKEGRTQGLQLFHWTKNLNLRLRFAVLEFNEEMSNLMTILENDFAKELNPIIGKHK